MQLSGSESRQIRTLARSEERPRDNAVFALRRQWDLAACVAIERSIFKTRLRARSVILHLARDEVRMLRRPYQRAS
jgi:hypothetical protein